jgi:hypothetical protein
LKQYGKYDIIQAIKLCVEDIMTRIKYLKEKVIVGIIVAIGILLGRLFDMTCIFLWLTGYECPGCGMMRALQSALRVDLVSAFQYHRMFWSIPILGLYVLFDGRLFKNKVLNILVLVLIATGFVINWVLNLVG